MSFSPVQSRKQKRGVIFGGSGLIGGTIVNYFQRKQPGSADMMAPSSKKVSLRNCQDIRDYLRSVKPDFIINTAITKIDSDSQLSFEVNYLGPLNIARAAAALGIPYIHLSSAASLPLGTNLTEEDCKPVSADLSNYAKSKLMAEKTLEYMAAHEGLDYSCIRLAIVYGDHDHKIQGFHRLLFSVADGSMPFLFTQKGAIHSYSNSRKLPYLVHHMLTHREEFSGQTYHFVDPEPVELAHLILTIRDQLNLKRPKELYIPYSVAGFGQKGARIFSRMLTKLGLKATLPAELMFLSSFYKTQTLSCKKLDASSFEDPFPNETVYTRLPEMITYYLTRWTQENLISNYDDRLNFETTIKKDFDERPEALLKDIHHYVTTPFYSMTDEPPPETR